MSQTVEHILIFNVVKDSLNTSAPGLSELMKNAIATQIAIKLRGLVRVKERDE